MTLTQLRNQAQKPNFCCFELEGSKALVETDLGIVLDVEHNTEVVTYRDDSGLEWDALITLCSVKAEISEGVFIECLNHLPTVVKKSIEESIFKVAIQLAKAEKEAA